MPLCKKILWRARARLDDARRPRRRAKRSIDDFFYHATPLQQSRPSRRRSPDDAAAERRYDFHDKPSGTRQPTRCTMKAGGFPDAILRWRFPESRAHIRLGRPAPYFPLMPQAMRDWCWREMRGRLACFLQALSMLPGRYYRLDAMSKDSRRSQRFPRHCERASGRHRPAVSR